MLKEAIYHRPKNNYAYAYNEKTLHIRLRTKKNDIHEVSLLHGDPYDWKDEKWKYNTSPMKKLATTELYDYWSITITPDFRRLRYAFLLRDHCETTIFTEKGFYKEPLTDDIAPYFCFPFINPEDVFSAPSWVQDTVWYQIFPERFANGDSSLNPDDTLAWGSTDPTPINFFGGDFEGIINHIDYLVKLGISGIYFTPIFKATSNHKYDTIDYMEIDAQFGDKETFKRLVEVCHKNGIRVMLDAVFNHSGFYFPPFQDVIKNGELSLYKDWFYIHKFPIVTEPIPSYDTFAFTYMMPKLNTAHPTVRDYLLEVGRYWVREFNIDGWRLDVANEVSHDFWREFRKEVKAIKPDVYILGEIWHDSMPWLQGDQFDAVMNYPYTNAAIKFFAENTIHAEEFVYRTAEAMLMYPTNATEVTFNLLGSHDTPRILTVCKNNKDIVKQLFAFLLSSSGSPCIYYGDEISMKGSMDPGCRACMIWDKENQDLDMFEFISHLILLRKTIPAFGNKGTIDFIKAEGSLVMYKKTFDGQKIVFAYNNSSGPLRVNVPSDSHIKQFLYADFRLKEKLHSAEITLGAHGLTIWEC
ncbi:glycoside hydrolase family 13 protein [Ectobacillus sp. sgz5001026]|uniref:glycoside hydrolase family 13 protein n=1 Tax=Ectobacillus sp. sgz5001026 TaxID=3242473 RepID=UPI0036D43D98